MMTHRPDEISIFINFNTFKIYLAHLPVIKYICCPQAKYVFEVQYNILPRSLAGHHNYTSIIHLAHMAEYANQNSRLLYRIADYTK